MMKQFGFFLICCLGFSLNLTGQTKEIREAKIDGKVVKIMVTETGDTIMVADLEDVSITGIRKFKNRTERRHYLRMRYHANKVYPYAVEAIRVFREIEAATDDMKKRKRRKYIKQLQKDLDDKFRDPLKKLTRTQGLVLIKMIEREIDKPLYSVVKDMRGGLTATYWQGLSKFYGFDLKKGYNPEDDPILEIILSGMDVSHDVVKR